MRQMLTLFRILALLAMLSVSLQAAKGERLSKGSFGDQEAHLERINSLTTKLKSKFAIGQTDGDFSESRALAATLRAALADMMMQAGRAEAGAKAAPPPAPIQTLGKILEGEAGVVSLDSLLKPAIRARDDATALALMIEQGGVAQEDMSFIVQQIDDAIRQLNRASEERARD